MTDDEKDLGEIVRAEIDPDPETAEYDLLSVISTVDGREIEDLPSLYVQIDHLVESLFKNPPAPEAHATIEFSYAGYRVTLTQNGKVTVVPVRESIRDS